MHRSFPPPLSRFPKQGQRNSPERNYAGKTSSRPQNCYRNERASESSPQKDHQRYPNKHFNSQFINQEYISDTLCQTKLQHPHYKLEHNYKNSPQFAPQHNNIEYRHRTEQETFRGALDSRIREEPRNIQNSVNQYDLQTESDYPAQTSNLDYKDKEMSRFSQKNNEIYKNMKQSHYTHYEHSAYRFNEDNRYPEANTHRYSAYRGEHRFPSQSSTGSHLNSYEPRYSNQAYPARKINDNEPQGTGHNYPDHSQYREDSRFPIHKDLPRYPYRDEPHSQQNKFAYKNNPHWQAQNDSPDRRCREGKYPYQPAYLKNQRGFKQQYPVQRETASSRYNGPRQSSHDNYNRNDFNASQSRYYDKANPNASYSSNHQVNQSSDPSYRPYDYRAPLQKISHRLSEQDIYKKSFVLNANATEFIPNPSLIVHKSKKPLLIVFDLNGVLILRKKKTQIVRPFATEFIDFVAKHFYIAVWSSARKENVDSMVNKAFLENQSQLIECWDRSKCELNGRFSDKCDSFKDLSKLWSSLDRRYSSLLGCKFGENNTIIIDDSPTKIKYQPSNQIRISEYAMVDPEDIELQQLKRYFETLLENLKGDSFDIRDYLLESKFKSTKELNCS